MLKDRIREVRHQLRLNQTQLGNKLGVTQRTICRWEVGFIPRGKHLQKLVEIGGVEPRWLILGQGEPLKIRITGKELLSMPLGELKALINRAEEALRTRRRLALPTEKE